MKRIAVTLTALMFVFVAGTAVAATGEELFKACAGCHGADGSKTPGGSPAIRGQSEEALLKNMQGYLDGSFGGAQKKVMVNILQKRTPEELKLLAAHMATLK